MMELAAAYFAKLRSLVLNLSRRERAEADLNEELHAYADMLADEKRARGMAAKEALRSARIELGGLDQVKEQVRDVRAGATIHALLRDLRYGARLLRRSPGFAAVTVATLALCIGANTALFSFVHTLLLRPLPYADSDRLVYVSEYWPHEPIFRRVPSPDYGNWRTHGKTFDAIEAYRPSGVFHLTGNGDAERLDGASVTAGFLNLIGTHPVAGRSFVAEECRPGAPPVVMLSHSLWQRRFNSTPEAISQTIVLNGKSHVVVGVLPARFFSLTTISHLTWSRLSRCPQIRIGTTRVPSGFSELGGCAT